jgi:hypothetical protein
MSEDSAPEASHVSYSREESAPIPTVRRMMVSGGDWRRVRRNVERLGEPLTDQATTWAATAVGGCIGVAGSLVALYATEDKPDGRIVLGLAVALGFLVAFAICFGLIGRTARKRHKISVATVCEDMDEITVAAGREDLVPPTPKPRPSRVPWKKKEQTR